MEPFDASVQRWLFAMTHPDDEISIAAWIAELAKQSREVWMSWTHHTPVREAEARGVAARLGVADDRLFFHGATDGNLCGELKMLRPKFEAMMAQVKPDRVVAGAFEQGHLDHDSTNWLVHQTFDGPIFEIPFYHSYLTRAPRINRFADPRGEAIRFLDTQEKALKIAIAKSYPSQNIWRNLFLAEIRARLTGDGSLLAAERMRQQPPTDFSQVALPEPMASRVRARAQWQRWLAAIQAA